MFFDDGYGFARHSDAMLLWYATHEPERLAEALVHIMTNPPVTANRLADAAMVGMGPRGEESDARGVFVNSLVVYPPDKAGTPMPD